MLGSFPPKPNPKIRAPLQSLGSDNAAISMTKMPTIAFFGATGGCMLAALSCALESGYYARALARTPEKLEDMLKKRGFSPALLDAKLVVVKGNAKDPEASKKAVVDGNGRMVDQIVFGIGGTPKFTPNPLKPTLDDPHVCEESIGSINTALRDIKSSSQADQMPLLTAISTTGISEKRDTPLIMSVLYHLLGAVPHADKKRLEEQVELAKTEGLIRDFVVVRPSLLIDGQTQGRKEVRVGWEGKTPGELGEGAAVGYTITREDVGHFVFDSVIAKNGADYAGKKVSITH